MSFPPEARTLSEIKATLSPFLSTVIADGYGSESTITKSHPSTFVRLPASKWQCLKMDVSSLTVAHLCTASEGFAFGTSDNDEGGIAASTGFFGGVASCPIF